MEQELGIKEEINSSRKLGENNNIWAEETNGKVEIMEIK